MPSVRIFISYRREDSAYPAGWLFDRLAERFGAQEVFKDVDFIRPGDDFVLKIMDAVRSCTALLAVIGDRWLTVTDEYGHRRLDNPGDFVRLEISAALARSIPVIPVLVNGAQMPRVRELPDNLRELASRQAVELSSRNFNSDVSRLLRALESPRRQTDNRPPVHSDNGGFRHYISKSDSYSGISGQKPVRALCGWTWIPKMSISFGDDLSRFPMCPRCKDVYDALPP
jgi:hypothetical protein